MDPELKPKLRNPTATALRDKNCIQLDIDPSHSLLLTGEVTQIRQFLAKLDGEHTVAQLISQFPFAKSLLFNLEQRGLIEAELLTSKISATLTADQISQLVISQRSYQAVSGNLSHAKARLTNLANAYLWIKSAGPASALLSIMLAQQQIGRLKLESLDLFTKADLPPWLELTKTAPQDLTSAINQASANIKLTQPTGTPDPDLILIADQPWLDPEETTSYLNRGIPHLMISPKVSEVSIGPLVIPGSSSCLICNDQAISNVDKSWPVMRHLIGQHQRDRTDWALLQLAVSFAVVQIVSAIGGGDLARSQLVNQRWRFRLPGPRIEVQSQPASMFCSCQWGVIAA